MIASLYTEDIFESCYVLYFGKCRDEFGSVVHFQHNIRLT